MIQEHTGTFEDELLKWHKILNSNEKTDAKSKQ